MTCEGVVDGKSNVNSAPLRLTVGHIIMDLGRLILSSGVTVIGTSFGFWAHTQPAVKSRIPKTKHTLFFIRLKF